jgi:hypothetical protein
MNGVADVDLNVTVRSAELNTEDSIKLHYIM